jgi:hypothetical protein
MGSMALRAAAVLGAMLLLSILFLHLPLAATDPLVGFMWTNPFIRRLTLTLACSPCQTSAAGSEPLGMNL